MPAGSLALIRSAASRGKAARPSTSKTSWRLSRPSASAGPIESFMWGLNPSV